MTEFIIKEIGFYKNRNGEKVEIVGLSKDYCVDKNGFDYSLEGSYWGGNKISGCDIVEKWEQNPITPQFYIVWTPSGLNPTKKHESQKEAETEALRLLKKHPEKKFYVMRCDGVAEAQIEYQYNPTF